MTCVEIFRKSLIFAFFCAFIALLIDPIKNLREPQIGAASYGRFDGHMPSVTICPHSRHHNISTFKDLRDLPSLKQHVNVIFRNYFKGNLSSIDNATAMKETFDLSPDEISKEPIITRDGDTAKCLIVHTPQNLQENWQVHS